MDGGRRGSVSDRDAGRGKGKEKAANGGIGRGDTYNARTIRDVLRVFIATGLGMRAYETILARVKGQKGYVVL